MESQQQATETLLSFPGVSFHCFVFSAEKCCSTQAVFPAVPNLDGVIQGSQCLTVCAPRVVEADHGGGVTTGELDKGGAGRLSHTRIL